MSILCLSIRQGKTVSQSSDSIVYDGGMHVVMNMDCVRKETQGRGGVGGVLREEGRVAKKKVKTNKKRKYKRRKKQEGEEERRVVYL